MGIRFTTNTWRAPLQLIDSWLPAPTFNQQAKTPQKVAQQFIRAGWLGRHAKGAGTAANVTSTQHGVKAPRPRRVHELQNTDPVESSRTEARLVISGHINDVCAELDRLAALEHQALRRQA